MQIIIISGRSGSGKSTTLNVLEDNGFNCIDNLPVDLLLPLIENVKQSRDEQPIAIGVDARNSANNLLQLPGIIKTIIQQGHSCHLLYLDANNDELITRYSETRRKHPLSNICTDLIDAITREDELLTPVREAADQIINTTTLNYHDLRDHIKKRFPSSAYTGMAIQFKSFGFKYGLPSDADLVFDVRCITNPHWQTRLREQTGKDRDVMEFLSSQSDVQNMLKDVKSYLEKWLPSYEANNRSYITIAVGCTGGKHRSVYISEQLNNFFKLHYNNVQVRHRELD